MEFLELLTTINHWNQDLQCSHITSEPSPKPSWWKKYREEGILPHKMTEYCGVFSQ
jgi:hypothetical protein